MTTAVRSCPPRVLYVPDHTGTYGDEVLDLAATVGLHLDDDQRVVTDSLYAHDEHGELVCTEAGVAAPRQNVKTHTAKAAALADLVLFREPDCLWTAHLRDTSNDSFRNAHGTGLADLFESFDGLRRMVERSGIVDSDGEKSITLRPRAAGEPRPTLHFVTRSERGGRGLSGRRVTFDEALFLKPSMTSAMLPILSAQSMAGGVQVRYLGSPGLPSSKVWRDVRDRGRSGLERAMCWVEWGSLEAPCEGVDCRHVPGTPGCALDREDLVRQANLAVDRRIDIRFVMTTERGGMEPEDFMRERLGWWLDPASSGGALDVQRWDELADPHAERGTPTFGVDVDEDRRAWIAVAWKRADGHTQVQLTGPHLSPLELDDRVARLTSSWGGRVASGSDLAGATMCRAGDFAQACARFGDLLTARSLRHGNQPELNTAVGAAQWRSHASGGDRAFRLSGAPEIGPLAAAVRAVWLLNEPVVSDFYML